MNQKVLAISIILLGLASLFTTLNFKTSEDFLTNELIKANNNSCILENNYCLHTDKDYSTYYFGIIIGLIIIATGAYVLYEYNKPKLKTKKFKEPKELTEEEQEIYKLIKESEGTIYQSDLVNKTEHSKVKITRILDKLENKKIIERKRRGMTNLVVLK
ncbi:MAG: hypothetical protein GON13_01270 [Nanoarchaeota archaeon]|nr:hypothetical protein [Nanoarchaeota archaeon]